MKQSLVMKELAEEDLGMLFAFERTNDAYFALEQTAPLTLQDVTESFFFVPPGFDVKNKRQIGFYAGDVFVAFADCLLGYPDEKTLFIGLLLVHGALHGKGIGTAALRALLDDAIKKGFTRVRLACRENNEAGQRFWRRAGFAFVELRPRIGGKNSEGVLLYERTL